MYTEEWRIVDWIHPFENMYSVSDAGHVRSEYRPKFSDTGEFICWTKGRELKPFHSRRYLMVKFSSGGIEKTLTIHRLVARAFIPIPERLLKLGLSYDDLEVNHKDGDPSHNCVTNLEWCTKEENMRHAVDTGLILPGRKGGESPRAVPVAMYDLEGNLVKVFPSIVDAGHFFSGRSSHIAAVCRGQRYTSFCHIFRYVDNIEAVETKISVPKLPHTSLDQIKRKKYDIFRSAGLRAAEELTKKR